MILFFLIGIHYSHRISHHHSWLVRIHHLYNDIYFKNDNEYDEKLLTTLIIVNEGCLLNEENHICFQGNIEEVIYQSKLINNRYV